MPLGALFPFPRVIPREKGKDRREGDRVEEGKGEARHTSSLPACFADGGTDQRQKPAQCIAVLKASH